ncbi:MAG: TAT-variant-translocated molybdopterin oxidoreductase [Bdellovibrionales bacterium]
MENQTNSKYWMSLDQWRQDPEFQKLVENEFRSSPLQSEDGQGGWARREFLKLMGASIALSSFGCIRRPAQKIIPYAKRPTDLLPGIPNYYASSYIDGLESFGVIVTTRDGRPLKIEGNPDHPGHQGGMSARAHAHILKLYDPDRFTSAKQNLQNAERTNRETVSVKWEDLDKAVIEQLKKGRVAFLSGTLMSPTTRHLVEEFVGASNAKVYHHDDLSYTNLVDGQAACYGQRGLPRYDLTKARYILAVNNDFLGTWLTPTHFQNQFRQIRQPGDKMARLVSVESNLSMTGTNADIRYRIRPSQTLDALMAILHHIVLVKKASRYHGDDGVVRVLSTFSKGSEELGFDVASIADELLENKGQSIVLAGGPQADTEEGKAIYVAANFLNAVLENDGSTVFPVNSNTGAPGSRTLDDLLQDIAQDEVRTLIVHGCNPAYSRPGLDWSAQLKKVEMVIYTGDRNDETGRLADYLACDHHPLENWGDAVSLEGVVSIQQPTIRPLHETRAMQDSLLAWMKGLGKGSARANSSETWYDYLRTNWRDEGRWTEILQTGIAEGRERPSSGRGFQLSSFTSLKPGARRSGFELAIYSTVGLGDGQLANVPWLQEFPDPVTKIVWDNYACFSPRDAKEQKLTEGQHVSLRVGENELELPVHIQPGQADGVVAVALGYGRKGAGSVADGVGQNALKLAVSREGRLVTAGLEVKVERLKECTKLACTQDHHYMEGRQIVVEETLHDHIKNPGGAVHRHHITSMWDEHKYPGHKWGMTVDLNTCTGCSACVIACQSENNIPVVGKKYVLQGREMHWIRIDRYYVGTPDDPDTVHQPVLCQHCDNAPCETVCPVAATTHSDEGTNDMIYNRCVGTRYCSNNCPYKVRRFNWFDYTEIPAPRHLALNPEVTVRHRGVMEKCTFCIHRINYSKQQAKLADRELRPNEIQTACQQSCPTKAITFGDLNNTHSAVRGEFTSPKSYALLEELNAKPAVQYQVKVRHKEELKGEHKRHEGGHH